MNNPKLNKKRLLLFTLLYATKVWTFSSLSSCRSFGVENVKHTSKVSLETQIENQEKDLTDLRNLNLVEKDVVQNQKNIIQEKDKEINTLKEKNIGLKESMATAIRNYEKNRDELGKKSLAQQKMDKHQTEQNDIIQGQNITENIFNEENSDEDEINLYSPELNNYSTEQNDIIQGQNINGNIFNDEDSDEDKRNLDSPKLDNYSTEQNLNKIRENMLLVEQEIARLEERINELKADTTQKDNLELCNQDLKKLRERKQLLQKNIDELNNKKL